MNYKNMKISSRLIFGFGLLTLLIALMGGISVVKTNHLGEAFDQVVNDRYAKIATLNSIKEGMHQMSGQLRNAVIMTNPDDIKAQLNEVESVRKGIVEHWEWLHKTIKSDKGKELLANAEELRRKYVAVHQRVVGLIAEGKREAAATALLGDLRPVQQAYFAGVDQFVEFQKGLMDEDARQTASDISGMEIFTGAFGVAAIVAAVLLSIWLIRAITRPLGQAVDIAQAVADGDLSMEFDAEGNSETAQLLRALKNMQSSLVKVVSHVRQNAEALASATGEISLGNTDLAQRTEEQAAALEETAASMEQLTGTVHNNAENARQATEVTTSASNIAQRGGDVVERVVETMQGISQSSDKVAEIISVIEGIAFQTNILALNAAVEAARAGEQGRGFSVVASEIRALAQRSSTAAKEIQALISDSVSRVNAGSRLVNEAGSTMTEIVQSVKRVTDMMDEIATASKEQSTGIEQVNTAVSQMEQMTQQNAALVEQASAAAQSLVDQAESLRAAVAVFKIAGQAANEATRTSAAPAPKAGRLVAPVSAPRSLPGKAKLASASAVSEWETF